MKKLGLIGGLSWTTSARYYQIINQAVCRAHANKHNAPLVIDSLDFAEVGKPKTAEEWQHAATILIASAQRLEKAGADALLICSNSMHKVYDDVQNSVDIPIVNIASEIGRKMQSDGIKKAALIGMSCIMNEDFYRTHIEDQGISLIKTHAAIADKIDHIVYNEINMGKITRDAERYMRSELTDIAKQKVEAIAHACPELEMVVDVKANILPIYDSTTIHAQAGVDIILNP